MHELQQLLKTKGIVYSYEIPTHSAFIMPDGSFLGLDSNSQVIANCSNVVLSHRDFKLFLIREHLVQEINENCLLAECNAIQINDGLFFHQFECAYVNITSEPTENQYQSLLQWLDYISLQARRQEVKILCNGHFKHYTFLSKINIIGLLPEDIIKDIQRIYKKDSV